MTLNMTAKLPTDECWQLDDLVKQVLNVRQEAFKKRQYGPFIVLCGSYWRERLGTAYVLPKRPDSVPDVTLKGRILRIESIVDVVCCEQMWSFDLTLVQVAADQDAGYKFAQEEA